MTNMNTTKGKLGVGKVVGQAGKIIVINLIRSATEVSLTFIAHYVNEINWYLRRLHVSLHQCVLCGS